MPTDLRGYMGSGYKRINPALLANRLTVNTSNLPKQPSGMVQPATTPPGDLENSVLTIDRELDELGTPVPASTVLYRRAGMVADYYTNGPSSVPAEYTQAAYMSCSKNKSYAYESNCKTESNQMFFTITCMALGAARDVMSVRGNVNEAEVLFHRNAKFTVDAAIVDKRGNAHWKMTEIASDAGYVWGGHHT